MRGEVCVSSATFLSFTSLLLLIFAHVGQISTASVPRGISMVKVNTSHYIEGINAAIQPDVALGVYTTDDSQPLQQHNGLRQSYQWGLYSYCAHIDGSNGLCSNQSAAFEFRPYDVILGDLRQNYTTITNAIITTSYTFRDSSYLSANSKAAYYLILLGSICAALALFTGVLKYTATYFLSTTFAGLGAVLLLIGATIWTVLVHKASAVSGIHITSNGVSTPIGIDVSVGPGVFLVWAAFVTLLGSLIPYIITCCTYRG